MPVSVPKYALWNLLAESICTAEVCLCGNCWQKAVSVSTFALWNPLVEASRTPLKCALQNLLAETNLSMAVFSALQGVPQGHDVASRRCQHPADRV